MVLAGSGAVEVIDKDGFSRVELHQHDALVFSPGTIHRLINPNRDLEILVIMQNSGLPERGDNVVTFTEKWLTTDAAYTEAMHVETVEDAYQRRDRGVEGFNELKAAFANSAEEGRARLSHFYDLARDRTAKHLSQWQERVTGGALTAAQTSLEQIKHLENSQQNYLFDNQVAHITANGEPKPGFCGHLNRYFDPATLYFLEGKQTS